ncbi:Kinesin-like protein KIF28P like protein [Argiope bruennichi]|uniref:Kinesin-like protein 6 n=1 Tax=Argiope bruennichi TaxID=94029 RepID=A0A8T0EX16_ARGBR|nr:Kinesin-like protein KIF28P like protein [Argiope bruennichi]
MVREDMGSRQQQQQQQQQRMKEMRNRMPDIENVRVAVRVRPFSQREKQRNARNIISMYEKTTFLNNPDYPSEESKKFTFDYSYWSFDGFRELENGLIVRDESHPNGDRYCDQLTVYNDLGKGVLHNAWEGYNSTLFAYGQTSSGKSWSIVGYGVNKGIVPMFCEDLFKNIADSKAAGERIEFEVRFSMLEIYNEIVRDLINISSSTKKRGLKVREHPTKGFFAEGLSSTLVTSYKDIQAQLDLGTTNRSIASTNMNATSSRAHTIVGITLIQKSRNVKGQETSKTSVVNLVDLAGSERASATGATGDRLKESAAINQSLSCLGNCIHSLAERATGRNIRVPYRDSVLTRLLMNALGGNSKTIMIACISPADINFEETLSTLRYADRAKQIKTVATINEDPTETLIRELRAENDRLKKMLERGVMNVPIKPGMTDDEVVRRRSRWEEEMKAAMAENERELQQIKQSYEEKLRQARQAQKIDAERAKLEELKKQHPHLSNLNFDPQLSGKILHILKKGANRIGKEDNADILLLGPSIQENHAIIHVQEADQIIIEKGCPEARILLNGEPVTSQSVLKHNDRIMFGTTQLYVYQDPENFVRGRKYPEITYEMAQEEIAAKAGINLSDDNSRESALLNKDLLEVLPGVEVANSISEELDKRVRFEIMLVSPQMIGKSTGRTEVYVKMKNLDTRQEYEWPKQKFLNRLYVMKEMYQNYEAEEDWDLPAEMDPFLEDPDTEVRIGTVQVYLQPLSFMVELKEQLEIINYKGSEVGIINVEVCPCSDDGKEYTEQDDQFVESPNELIGRNLYFIIRINGCRGIPSRFTDVNCKYRVYLDETDTITETVSDTSNPDFHHQKMFSFTPVTRQVLSYLKDGFIVIQVWGKQKPRKSAMAKAKGRSTKQMIQEDLLNQTSRLMNGFRINGRNVDPNKQSMIVELLLMKKQQQRHIQKLENIGHLVDIAEKQKMREIPLPMVKEILFANSNETAAKVFSKILPKGSVLAKTPKNPLTDEKGGKKVTKRMKTKKMRMKRKMKRRKAVVKGAVPKKR